MKINKVRFEDLGKMPYKEAWDYQTVLHNELLEMKRQGNGQPPLHHLLFVEHPPVYTLGKSGSEANLLIDEQKRNERGISYYKINRGGDITYHGPGQIVVYPIFDLDHFKNDVRWFVYHLEESIIQLIKKYGVESKRIQKHTGVWIDHKPGEPDRKICAVGVHLSRWVSLHGIAFNVNTDLSYFDMIIPCGISDKSKTVTSLQKEIGHKLDYETVKMELKAEFAAQFEFEYV